MRYALIKNGVVQNVIVAEPEFVRDADPAWKARFDAIRALSASEERICEPGSTWNGTAFARPVRAEQPAALSLEDRIKALEDAQQRAR